MAVALVTGANRGLGLEFSRQYAADGWRVIAVCRTSTDNDELADLAGEHDIDIRVADVSDVAAVDALSRDMTGTGIDLIVNNAGVFGPKAQAENDFRQSFGHMDYELWMRLLRVNTLAPFKIVEAFHENLRIGGQKKVVTISSTIGSVSNADAGIYAYRSSKAAVNILMAALAKELAEDGIAVCTFCPGWVNTRMGGDAAPITPEASVTGMRKLIKALSMENSGEFRRFNGEAVPW